MSRTKNEGEGSRSADRNYRKRTATFIASGKVSAAARRAAKAVSSGERRDLEKAEAKGKAKARH